MTVIKCDRCGRIYVSGEQGGRMAVALKNFMFNLYDDSVKDLCGSCICDLSDFMSCFERGGENNGLNMDKSM